jgi:hypothetical protein
MAFVPNAMKVPLHAKNALINLKEMKILKNLDVKSALVGNISLRILSATNAMS